MQEILAAPEWLEALTLAERAAFLDLTEGPPLTPEQTERAARKAARWRSECSLEDDALFAERLALEGLTPERFLRLLAGPAAGLSRPEGRLPEWIEELEEAFFRPVPPLPAELGGTLGILELLRPLIARGYAQVLDGLRRIARTAPLEPEALAAALFETLVRRLRWAGERALVLELHVARLEGRLEGETPQERYESFLSSLRRPETALKILLRYPVLARDACRHVRQWVETGLEIIERFAADRPEIVRSWGGEDGDPGALVSAEGGLSDRHAGGRSVAVLTFASGLRVVYKPKPLAVDLRFQSLVAWLNERGAAPPLPCLTILDRGAYGWMEHVAAHPCALPEEVERFYERLGAWVALFYVLEATDFHHENLIASGEHPVPVDLETLLQPMLEGAEGDVSGAPAVAATVLRSGLLPRKVNANPGFAGFDLSGMGGLGGRTVQKGQVVEEGTDRMRWGTLPSRMDSGPNVPTLNGEPLELSEHGESVLRGFESLYRLIWRHREEMEARLDAFRDLPIRVLLRGTAVYAHLLNVGYHPDYLRNGLDRERLYDRLWLEAIDHPVLRRGFRLERADLLAGDVPRFEGFPGSADLLHPAGRVEDFLAVPGLERVRERLRGLDEEDLERQSWLVRAAIESTRPEGQRRRWQRDSLPETGPAEPRRFLSAACRLGDRLARLAVRQGERVGWFSLDVAGDSLRLEPVGPGLYSGLSGFALFYAHLGRLSGDESYERWARQALGTVRRRMERAPDPLPPFGSYSGLGGIVYTLTHLGLLWDEPTLLDEAEGLVERIAAGVEHDRSFDLIGGAAGSAVCLLELYRHRPSPAVLAAAVRCGDHLLAHAVQEERGWSWPAPAEISELPLTGFGHGTAGIAWALARLARVCGDERFRDAARGALRYERSWFCPERESWPDLRKDRETPEGRPFFYAWCHGAPGIGLGRVAMLSSLDDPEILSEIRAAVRSTLAEGFGTCHCLCHGDLGNLDLLRKAAPVLGDPELAVRAGHLAAGALSRIEEAGPRCGGNTRNEIPGLLTGLAGIGYGLLQAAFPDRVPSVLLLETQGPGPG